MLLVVFRFRMQEPMRDFLKSLVAQERAAQHQQRGDYPGHECAQRQGNRHHDQFVDRRPLEHGPHDRQFASGPDTAHLLGVQSQIVSEHTRGFLGCRLGQHGDVVKQRCDVIEQGKQTGTGQKDLLTCRESAMAYRRKAGILPARLDRRAYGYFSYLLLPTELQAFRLIKKNGQTANRRAGHHVQRYREYQRCAALSFVTLLRRER